jgi:hypothetical protein
MHADKLGRHQPPWDYTTTTWSDSTYPEGRPDDHTEGRVNTLTAGPSRIWYDFAACSLR